MKRKQIFLILIPLALLIAGCTNLGSHNDKLIHELRKESPDIEKVKELIEKDEGKSGMPLLLIASFKGHAEIVKYLVASGADVDTTSKNGYTPLHIASSEGHFEVVKLLVDLGADVSKTNKDGYSPLFIASSKGYSEIVEYLLKQIVWISIPAGTFYMGSPRSERGRDRDEIRHQVKLSAYKISKYEVTFEQYDLFCEATGRGKPDDKGWGRGKRPVINVSWHDVVAFAEWIGCRLPTEAEWEYAFREGKSSKGYKVGDLAWYSKNSGNKTHPVGQKQANELGIYDMSGNVCEWCSDWYSKFPTGLQTNPTGQASGSTRVLRGGSWSDNANSLRAANRFNYSPRFSCNYFGFRLVCLGTNDYTDKQQRLGNNKVVLSNKGTPQTKTTDSTDEQHTPDKNRLVQSSESASQSTDSDDEILKKFKANQNKEMVRIISEVEKKTGQSAFGVVGIAFVDSMLLSESFMIVIRTNDANHPYAYIAQDGTTHALTNADFIKEIEKTFGNKIIEGYTTGVKAGVVLALTKGGKRKGNNNLSDIFSAAIKQIAKNVGLDDVQLVVFANDVPFAKTNTSKNKNFTQLVNTVTSDKLVATIMPGQVTPQSDDTLEIEKPYIEYLSPLKSSGVFLTNSTLLK